MRDTGALFEEVALAHLQRAGLTLLKRNYTSRLGEIDLILREKNVIVFVEVRYRESNTRGDGAASVGAAKRLKLVRTAKLYLQAHPQLASLTCRFDVLAIEGDAEQPQIRWLRAAFDAFH